MIVVANRILVAKDHEKEFENRFKNRAGLVDTMSGFIRNEILRPIQSDYYVILTYWESIEDFRSWTESEEFKKAHSKPPNKEIFAGPNIFEIHDVIMISEK